MFSLIILAILFVLQSNLFVPYYEAQRSTETDTFINQVEKMIDEGVPLTQLNRVTSGSNVCTYIFNDEFDVVYQADSIGDSCVLNKASFQIEAKLETLKTETSYIKEVNKDNANGLSSLIVGKKIENNLLTYYVLANMPMIPADSTLNILFELLLISTLFVIVIAFVISWYFSKNITQPIVKIKNSADSLALGNYNADFKVKGYSEVEDLANTMGLTANKLADFDKMQKEVLSNISHDLKTPLTNIKAYSELIEITDDQNKRNQHLKIINEEVEFMSSLVSEMTTISKDEVIDLYLEKFNLSYDLLSLLDSYSKQVMHDYVKFESYIDDEVYVIADKIKINQVVRNFIDNAIKYNDKDEVIIQLNLLKRSNVVIIEVVDNGLGITKEQIPLIWDRYYQVSSNFHRSKTGSGLGLSIAKSILQQHSLKFGVDSEINKGSRFYFEMEVEDGDDS